MAFQQINRFRVSLFPGLAISFFLIAFLFTLLTAILNISADGGALFSRLNERDWHILKITIMQAALSTILSLAVGVLMAWALYHQRTFPGRRVLIVLLSSALVLPALVVVLGIVTVLGRGGWINSLALGVFDHSFGSYLFGLTGILIAHVYFNGSFAVRIILNRLEAIPTEKTKLSHSLGIKPLRRFILVEWPAISSSLPALASTIFLLCFTSFSIVLVLGGSPRFNTLEVAIYEAIKLDFDLTRAIDLAILQLLFCAALVLFSSQIKVLGDVSSIRQAFVSWREPIGARVLQFVTITIFAIFFILPLAAIIIYGLKANFYDILMEPAFQKSIITSLSLAIVSSLLTLVFCILLAAAKRNFTVDGRITQSRLGHLTGSILSFSVALYLVVPSLVLGLGFFLLARQLPGALSGWAVIAVLTANVLMALPFSMASLVPAMDKSARRYDHLAFTLDLGIFARWRIIEWPLLRSEIGYILAISFCFSMGDLGVIALFGSQDFATLPWYLYQKMGSYQTDDAAGVALIMLMITILVFWLLPRLFAKTERNNNVGN